MLGAGATLTAFVLVGCGASSRRPTLPAPEFEPPVVPPWPQNDAQPPQATPSPTGTVNPNRDTPTTGGADGAASGSQPTEALSAAAGAFSIGKNR